MYEIEISHSGLNKYRHIRGADRHVVEQKAQAQLATWDEMWAKKQEAEQKRMEKEQAIKSKEGKKELAKTKTKEAEIAVSQLEGVLAHTLSVNDAVNWDGLLDKSIFSKNQPGKEKLRKVPSEPDRTLHKYQPVLGLMGRLFQGVRKRKEDAADRVYLADQRHWESVKKRNESVNKTIEENYATAVGKWQQEKSDYETKQDKKNQKILASKERYQNREHGAVLDYCEMVLSNSIYPDYFPQEWDFEYLAESKVFIVDYDLPNVEALPTVKAVKYVIATDKFTETNLSSVAVNKLYDSLLYQIALRTIHELYEADVVHALDSVVFNGRIHSIDKATGQDVSLCIMSIQASKDEFLAINLDKIDPKACFTRLKGVGSSKLHGMAPVAPIININKKDTRFIKGEEIIAEIDETNNLAAMDWQDFENLIREVFEKEFASSGGEVKITQASRDGGVDAVAFDPDPIRGGKIVIQAKRYTNTVGVAAVRDLYGTTVNEGATKGILVTTSDYGPDAYDFVKDKPLTLLSGANLLHLLEKHGHKAKIDLMEAKKLLSEQNS